MAKRTPGCRSVLAKSSCRAVRRSDTARFGTRVTRKRRWYSILAPVRAASAPPGSARLEGRATDRSASIRTDRWSDTALLMTSTTATLRTRPVTSSRSNLASRPSHIAVITCSASSTRASTSSSVGIRGWPFAITRASGDITQSKDRSSGGRRPAKISMRATRPSFGMGSADRLSRGARQPRTLRSRASARASRSPRSPAYLPSPTTGRRRGRAPPPQWVRSSWSGTSTPRTTRLLHPPTQSDPCVAG